MSVIPALRRLRQEDNEFKANLGHESRLSKKKKVTWDLILIKFSNLLTFLPFQN
jgi:hypothetical protein